MPRSFGYKEDFSCGKMLREMKRFTPAAQRVLFLKRTDEMGTWGSSVKRKREVGGMLLGGLVGCVE